jgi:hypothetical protein
MAMAARHTMLATEDAISTSHNLAQCRGPLERWCVAGGRSNRGFWRLVSIEKFLNGMFAFASAFV